MQTRAFSQLLELWRPVANAVRTDTNVGFSGVYYTLAYDNVRGRIGESPDIAGASPIGRTSRDMVYTFDLLRLHMEQECDDTWYVRDKAADQWYIVQGTPQNRHFRAKESVYQCARAEAPNMTVDAQPNTGNPE